MIGSRALRNLGFERIVGAAASTALTVPAGTSLAVVQCTSVAVRYRDDGTAPTSTIGMLLTINQYYTFESSLSMLRFIETSASTVLNVSYYG